MNQSFPAAISTWALRL